MQKRHLIPFSTLAKEYTDLHISTYSHSRRLYYSGRTCNPASILWSCSTTLLRDLKESDQILDIWTSNNLYNSLFRHNSQKESASRVNGDGLARPGRNLVEPKIPVKKQQVKEASSSSHASCHQRRTEKSFALPFHFGHI